MHKYLTRFHGLYLLWSSLLTEHMLRQGLGDRIWRIDICHTVIKLLVKPFRVDELWFLAVNLRQTQWTVICCVPSFHVSCPWHHVVLVQLLVILLTRFFVNQLYTTIISLLKALTFHNILLHGKCVIFARASISVRLLPLNSPSLPLLLTRFWCDTHNSLSRVTQCFSLRYRGRKSILIRAWLCSKLIMLLLYWVRCKRHAAFFDLLLLLLTVFPWRLRWLFIHEILNIVRAMKRREWIQICLSWVQHVCRIMGVGNGGSQILMTLHLVKRGCRCIHINRIKLLYCLERTKVDSWEKKSKFLIGWN